MTHCKHDYERCQDLWQGFGILAVAEAVHKYPGKRQRSLIMPLSMYRSQLQSRTAAVASQVSIVGHQLLDAQAQIRKVVETAELERERGCGFSLFNSGLVFDPFSVWL